MRAAFPILAGLLTGVIVAVLVIVMLVVLAPEPALTSPGPSAPHPLATAQSAPSSGGGLSTILPGATVNP